MEAAAAAMTVAAPIQMAAKIARTNKGKQDPSSLGLKTIYECSDPANIVVEYSPHAITTVLQIKANLTKHRRHPWLQRRPRTDLDSRQWRYVAARPSPSRPTSHPSLQLGLCRDGIPLKERGEYRRSRQDSRT
jgi:hypothetical protein